MPEQRRVKRYGDGPQTREVLKTETYQYHMPFNYSNITVFRKIYDGDEFHGVELEPINPPSPPLKVDRCPADEWFRAAAVFLVPPGATRLTCRLEVARQRRNDQLLIDDVSVTVVPAGFEAANRLPAKTRNLLRNAGFEQVDTKAGFARYWETASSGKGRLTVCDADKRRGKRAVLVRGVDGIAISQEVPAKEGQTVCLAAWFKSSTTEPRCILGFPVFYNRHGDRISDTSGDCIVVREKEPIVRVVVIGSACTPPGYVQIECDELDSWRRADEMRTVMPVRFRANNLWGYHLRADQWLARTPDTTGMLSESYETLPPAFTDAYPSLKGAGAKVNYQEFPFTGMSSAVFETPPSHRVIVRGGSEMPGWAGDYFPNDGHYSFRIIRTTVMKKRK